MSNPMSKKPPSFSLRCSSLNSVRLRRIFDMFNSNGDDKITSDEISKALSRLGLDADPSESSLANVMSKHVKPGNEGLSFDDFAALHKSLDDAFLEESEQNMGEESQESDLMEAFKVFDEDGNGFISAKELQAVLEKLGMPEAKEMSRVESMISTVDHNHDGVVDFSEFKDMMKNVIARTS